MTKMQIKKMKQQKRTSDMPFIILLLPFLLFFFVFTILPIASSIVLSFTDFNMVAINNFVGFDNYIRLFLEDDIFTIALKNTLIYALVSGPVGFILSFVVAWFINDLAPVAKNIVTLLMYSPALCGGMFTIWAYVFASDDKGLINSMLIRLGIINSPLYFLTDPEYNFIVCVIVIIWSSMGVGFLSLVSGLKSLDKSYFEAAALDGVSNRWQELYYVTLPQIGPQLIFSAVMTISSSFAVGANISALTGFPSTDYSTHTLVLHMTDYASTRFEIAVVLFVIMWVSWFAISSLLRKFTDD